ncbi:MAG: polyhydroxybutyrate depolymerase [Myxococcota bacterium]|jgi:polyhydroxybutyrate depolymerase
MLRRMRWTCLAGLLVLVGFGCEGESEEAAVPDAGSANDVAVADTASAADASVAPDEGGPEPDTATPPDTGPVFPAAAALPATFGGERPADYHLPENYDPAQSYPMVLLLHGYGANLGTPGSGGMIQDSYLKLSSFVTERQFVTLIPHGTSDLQNNQFWNAHPACCDFGGTGVDDVAYLTALLDEVSESVNIDSKRIYLMGHSNGAFMSYRMACETPERFAAVLGLAGMATDCVNEVPVSVLHVHGTLDTTIPYAGKTSPNGYISARETAEYWAQRNGCTTGPAETGAADLTTAVVGDESVLEGWSGCNEAAEVALWTLVGGGHIPAFTDDFMPNALDWLLARARP